MVLVHPVRVGSSGAEGIFGCLLMSLLRRYVLVPFGLSGAEGLALARLTSSLVRPPVIAPTLALILVASF